MNVFKSSVNFIIHFNIEKNVHSSSLNMMNLLLLESQSVQYKDIMLFIVRGKKLNSALTIVKRIIIVWLIFINMKRNKHYFYLNMC